MMGFVAPNLLQNHLIGSGQTNVNPGYVPAMAQFSYPSGNLQNELATTRIVQQSFTPAPAGSVSFQPPYAPQAGFPGAQPSFQPNLYATQSFSPSYNQGPQYSWVESDANSIPQRAFAGGRDLDGETLYVGRADHRGALTPG